MMYYVVENETGRIIKSGECPPGDVLIQAKEGQTVKQGFADDAMEYEVNGLLMPRPILPIIHDKHSVGIGETVTFSGSPIGTSVFFRQSLVIIDDPGDTDLRWSSTEAGEYPFRFVNFPYQDLMLKVTVTDE